jgi:hypothetical protein
MNRLQKVAALVLAVSIPGCVSARASMLTPERYAPVPEEQVRVYLAADEVPESCERIALIHAAGPPDATTRPQMIRAAQRRAGKIGANAIVLSSIRDPRFGTRVAAEVLGVSADRKGEMEAYRCSCSTYSPIACLNGFRTRIP